MQGTFAAALIGALLTACAGSPALEERHTAEELRGMLTAPPPRCERYGLGGWRPDPDCEREDFQKRAQIREALGRLHAADVAAAPACLRQYRMAPETVRKFGTDPSSVDAVPELISRGLVIASLSRSCAVAVCDWRKRVEPTKQSPYCEFGAHSETHEPSSSSYRYHQAWPGQLIA